MLVLGDGGAPAGTRSRGEDYGRESAVTGRWKQWSWGRSLWWVDLCSSGSTGGAAAVLAAVALLLQLVLSRVAVAAAVAVALAGAGAGAAGVGAAAAAAAPLSVSVVFCSCCSSSRCCCLLADLLLHLPHAPVRVASVVVVVAVTSRTLY